MLYNFEKTISVHILQLSNVRTFKHWKKILNLCKKTNE